MDPLATTELRVRSLTWARFLFWIVGGVVLVNLAVLAMAGELVRPWTFIGPTVGAVFGVWLGGARFGRVVVAVDDDRVWVRGPNLRSVVLRRADLHSIAPVWLRQKTVIPSKRVPLLGYQGVPSGGLVFVLREERRIAGRAEPLRGIVVAVKDVNEAQQPFRSWGLLQRMDRATFDWLAPKSTTMSPGAGHGDNEPQHDRRRNAVV